MGELWVVVELRSQSLLLLLLLLMTMAAILDFECISAFCRSEQNFCSPCWLCLASIQCFSFALEHPSLFHPSWEIFSTDWQLCKWAATRTRRRTASLSIFGLFLLLFSFVCGQSGSFWVGCIKSLFHFPLIFPFAFVWWKSPSCCAKVFMQVLLFWQMDILLLLQLLSSAFPPSIMLWARYLCYLYESWSDI